MWTTKDVQRKIQWRDGDIVVSAPPECGIIWAMNVVHQLREGGTDDFDDIFAEVPWLNLIDRPGRTIEELVERYDSMPSARRRAFGTNSSPPDLPYAKPTAGQGGEEGEDDEGQMRKDVRYVVVVRHPEEALGSLYPFMTRHSPKFLELWGLPSDAFGWPNFETFYRDFVVARELDKSIFNFMEKWWPLRNNENVLLLHYKHMKKDHEGCVRRISDFLGYDPPPDRWAKILEYTSFPWMKRHEHRFECRTVSPLPVVEPGSMLRSGESGLADQDGVTEEISREIASRGREILTDEEAFWFLYKGGTPLTQTPMI